MRQLNSGHYASKFATSWISFGRIFKPLEAGRLVRFQKTGKYMHQGKTQSELFLQFVRLLYSTFTKTAIKSK